MDYHAGGKWFIHGRKENQLLSLKHPCNNKSKIDRLSVKSGYLFCFFIHIIYVRNKFDNDTFCSVYLCVINANGQLIGFKQTPICSFWHVCVCFAIIDALTGIVLNTKPENMAALSKYAIIKLTHAILIVTMKFQIISVLTSITNSGAEHQIYRQF